MSRAIIKNFYFHNSNVKGAGEIAELFKSGILSDPERWQSVLPAKKIDNLLDGIESRLKIRMSELSLGIYKAIKNGPDAFITDKDEVYLFTGFAEIETTDKIINAITVNKDRLVSPTLFHNSVHNTPLGYWAIIEKKHNYCVTVSDGMETGLSFINFFRYIFETLPRAVIAAGDEWSRFLELDKENLYDLPAYNISYILEKSADKGIKYLGCYKDADDLISSGVCGGYNSIIADRDIFNTLKKSYKTKTVITDYPLVMDAPCGVILKFAMPSILEMDKALVVQKTVRGIYIFDFEA